MSRFIKQNLYFVLHIKKKGRFARLIVSKNVETTSAFLILGMRMKDDTNYIVRPEILVPKYRKTPCGLCRLAL